MTGHVLIAVAVTAVFAAVVWLVTGWIARNDWVPRAARAVTPPVTAVVVSGPRKGLGSVVVARVSPSGEEIPRELAIRLGAGHPAVAAITGPPRLAPEEGGQS